MVHEFGRESSLIGPSYHFPAPPFPQGLPFLSPFFSFSSPPAPRARGKRGSGGGNQTLVGMLGRQHAQEKALDPLVRLAPGLADEILQDRLARLDVHLTIEGDRSV